MITCHSAKLVITLCLQQLGHGHPRFPGGRGGFLRGPRAATASSNLIVIQTVPMEGDPESRQQLRGARLPGPRSQPAASASDAPTALLRPQDKWEAKETTKRKRM